MNATPAEQIAFDVETERILQILSEEIYDSPQSVSPRKRPKRIRRDLDALHCREAFHSATARSRFRSTRTE